MRLIDADAVKFKVEYGYDNNSILLVPYRDIKKSIEATKTVDAEVVVRCKDCKYSYKITGRWRCSHGICCGRHVPPNFYCADGKRKENDE